MKCLFYFMVILKFIIIAAELLTNSLCFTKGGGHDLLTILNYQCNELNTICLYYYTNVRFISDENLKKSDAVSFMTSISQFPVFWLQFSKIPVLVLNE